MKLFHQRGRRQAREDLGIVRPRLRMRDLATESATSVRRHPGRSLLTALGTILGAAAFVSTLGVGSTVQHQVSSSFDAIRATEVIVRPAHDQQDTRWQGPAALDRLRRLSGVAAAGRRLLIGEHTATHSLGMEGRSVNIIGADPQAVSVMAPHLVAGRLFDGFHESRAVRSALLASPIAESLGIRRIGVAVFIDDQAYTVMGVFDDVARRPEALLSIVIPASTAETLVAASAEPARRDIVIATVPGAAQLIGDQAALALLPESPAALQVTAPPDPRTLRRAVEDSVVRSSLILSAIALLIGGASIGNSATAAIAARTSEIGLRRAVGGRPWHIFAQLITETTALGGLGGVVGTILGTVATAVVSLWQSWLPVIDLRAAVLATAASALAGLCSGLWPAARAMRVQPVAALQR
jgi:putative ABC transport system permease protein